LVVAGPVKSVAEMATFKKRKRKYVAVACRQQDRTFEVFYMEILERALEKVW